MKVLYFAWLRERLNKGEETVSPPAEVRTVSDLIDWLAANDEAADLAFANRKLIKAAVNARIVTHDAPVAANDTVALFPPMTGG
ncbi:MAG: molybdopterin converting factor subunit 1 [Devosia nanyangense]|uniref:Molybdopterin converting factor subunit 1 n=1 Tax=Paradevosia shaoguanensis TaxID=1335043 RepID=A0AA41QNY8_9HYPH|nr:molybdopterin converting factor subunit 1 [Paradevosia shaoguanensis]MBI4047728.1 molybdopterin converting factor subunit 1 [Devosia nanyangense]MCF1743547.1 molybdopterin converting factor subunit 1 [Paradevosia shaoguanensis]MCI0128030.1 molybdopterin converting factor subunit 1 [Paradevosia shaoguanensis]QMV01145.1 molybdopterin converting factor subunit 1 [Devosia sp. D6-9]